MSDSSARSRKKNKKENKTPAVVSKTSGNGVQKGKASQKAKASEESNYLSFIWIPVVIAAGVYSYFNPSLILGLINDWIGFSEHFDGGPVASYSTPSSVRIVADIPKRDAVVKAFKHSWDAYERDAMGSDEYHPLSRQGSNLSKDGGIGYMVVDVLDTLQIMNLTDEFSRARKWLAEKHTFDRDAPLSTFEVTIRVLGGLLSAYTLSDPPDPLFLSKATELADRLLPAFYTTSGLPYPVIHLATRTGANTTDYPGLTSPAEVATLQLEFRYLAHLTENEEYWEVAERVMRVLKRSRLPHGLASIFLDLEEGVYVTSAIRLGSRGDSYYEYLLKQYIQTNNSENVYREMYEDAMDGVHNHLIQKSMASGLTYTSELIPETDGPGYDADTSWRLTPKQDHLACFLGGSLMLGATRAHTTFSSEEPKKRVSVPPRPDELTEKGWRDWKTGSELIRTCMKLHDTGTGLSPETVYFRVKSDGMDKMEGAPADWYIRGTAPGEFPSYDSRYLLRPETVESLFIAYRLTGDALYRDHAWQIFQAIEKHCKVPTGGYATVVNVDENPVRLEDKMETFFLSETLKYLYLLFSGDDVIPLDKYVLNTEAHPLPIFDPTIATGFS